jgi:hypothetical protein
LHSINECSHGISFDNILHFSQQDAQWRQENSFQHWHITSSAAASFSKDKQEETFVVAQKSDFPSLPSPIRSPSKAAKAKRPTQRCQDSDTDFEEDWSWVASLRLSGNVRI